VIEILKRVAKDAGDILKEGYYAKKDISHKGIVDLVTNYDVMCEEFIISELKKRFSDYDIIGEESCLSNDFNSKRVIYIDPIDGTTNFIHQIPHFAISIGVWEDDIPVMAVVYNPILDELYFAQKGEGAYCNDKKLSVSNQDTLQQALIGTGFPYAKVNRGIEYHWVIDTITSLLPNIRDIRRLGAASLDLCYLAEGKIDAFYEIDLKPWDIAGGILIILEAGGKVSSISKEFNFNDKVIVASNSKVHKELLSYLPLI
jgi:myo-inositol-1(or 4)-monophosphatase